MVMSGELRSTDITVNVDGLWLLQALLGITQLAPELCGRPYGQPRSTEWLTNHPGLPVLVEQGICDDGGVVRSDIATRMAVLAAPDVEVVVLVSNGPMDIAPPIIMEDRATWHAIPDEQLRIVLARREGLWVSAVRTGAYITIDDCGEPDQQRLERLVEEALDSVHRVESARISAVNVPLADMLAAAREHARAGTAAAKRAALHAVGLRGAVLAELGAALDEPVAEAVFYARAYADADARASESVLNVRDTASGRVALFRLAPTRGTNQQWMTIAPATPAQLHHAVTTVLSSVPVQSWDRHERMS